jgi:hypothetical protein
MVHWQPGVTLREVERQIVEKALQFFHGNKTKAAQSIGVSVRTIDNKIKQYEQDDQYTERIRQMDQQRYRDHVNNLRPVKDSDATNLPRSNIQDGNQ